MTHNDLIRTELETILASEVFKRSERLTGFLRLVVEETLAGRADSLKEVVLAAELYGKHATFNPADDAAVRNDARRLRDKLREYYAGASEDRVVITLPKGGYAPTFEVRTPPGPSPIASESIPQRPSRSLARPFLGIALAGLAVAISIGVWASRRREPEPADWRVVPLSSLPGSEGLPALSPDGNFVSFIWSGPKNDLVKSDLLIKTVGKEVVRHLADVPEETGRSAWSPDCSLHFEQR